VTISFHFYFSLGLGESSESDGGVSLVKPSLYTLVMPSELVALSSG